MPVPECAARAHRAAADPIEQHEPAEAWRVIAAGRIARHAPYKRS